MSKNRYKKCQRMLTNNDSINLSLLEFGHIYCLKNF
jgi:hypothetical protein